MFICKFLVQHFGMCVYTLCVPVVITMGLNLALLRCTPVEMNVTVNIGFSQSFLNHFILLLFELMYFNFIYLILMYLI